MPPKRRETAAKPAKAERLPTWITDHFTESLDSLQRLMQIVEISARGIGVLRGMPKIVSVLAKVEGTTGDAGESKRLERAEKEAELASTEVAKDFPVLHGFAVVALWSWAEHFIKGFVALWLMHRRDALAAAPLQKLRVRLGEYLHLQRAEQAEFLVELLEQELASPLKRGAARFESLLEPFDLSFPLPEGCGRALFELQQVRNALAHRNGRADRRLRSDCPWLKLKLNEPVQVDTKMLRSYSEAAAEFLLGLLYRTGDIYGMDLRIKGDGVHRGAESLRSDALVP